MKLAVGIGLNSKAEAGEIVALVEACLATAALDAGQIALVASSSRKAGSAPLLAAAGRFGVQLRLLTDEELVAVLTVSSSALALERIGLESVAEAAAGYFGPVLVGKRKSANATCAIAEMRP